MSRNDRIRRVVILCCAFARNLAYYRAGWSLEHKGLLENTFWRQVNNNFVDMCVLEWCKLFGDQKEKHYWGKIVTNRAAFKAGLLLHLGLDDKAFEGEISDMRKLRDEHIAHLDSDLTGYIPQLDIAKKTVWFYYEHVVNHEAKPGDLLNLPIDIDRGYLACEEEAKAILQMNAL